jgi:hypothetical protein
MEGSLAYIGGTQLDLNDGSLATCQVLAFFCSTKPCDEEETRQGPCLHLIDYHQNG